MKRTLLFKLIILLEILIFSSNGQSCLCTNSNNILQCSVTSSSPSVNADSCNSDEFNSINIVYSGSVVLNVRSSSIKPILIKPADGSDNHTLQISTITTQANRIQIQIYLSTNQASSPLFTTSSSIIAPSSTLSINVIQNITDAIGFKIFDIPTSRNMNFANYELIFDTTNTNSGTLYLPNLIYGLTNLTSITISGNNHALVVPKAQMPSSINVNQLSLKNLRLYDQILYNFLNLQEYSIEGCQYNKTAQFLNSDQTYNISLEMKNNNPIDLILPNDLNALKGLGKLKSLTIIEPQLNSSCLKPITFSTPDTLILELGYYYKNDFDFWIQYRPKVEFLTINNIKELDIFAEKYFNRFDAIQNLVLQGSFELSKEDLCIFTGITIQPKPERTNITLNSPEKSSNDWDQCADTYITAINQQSINNVNCPPNDYCEDCQRWADATKQCDLISYENNCGGVVINFNKPFTYNNSYLYLFFKGRYWLNGTVHPSGSSTPKQDTINIGAIIGAVCGLLIAIMILGLTVFCIYRYRQKDTTKNILKTPEEKYKPSSYDSTHVSIATSKTSQSSRYALQKSFFPPMQPNDQIAPPLYTAPSETVGSVTAYNLPSAPPAPRDSVSTHATHLYETLDP